MPLIYVKLGVGVSDYRDEQLNFTLEDPDVPAGVVDYGNMTQGFQQALNAGTIVQISEAEFNNIIGALLPITPINITTNYLISLNKYLNTCPADNAVMFVLQNNHWYKILWSKVKECVTGGLNILFRVGQEPAPYPQPLETTWTDPRFVGKDYKKLMFKLGNLELYEERMYDPATIADGSIMYYTLDNVAGTIEIPGYAFQATDIIRVHEA